MTRTEDGGGANQSGPLAAQMKISILLDVYIDHPRQDPVGDTVARTASVTPGATMHLHDRV